MTAGLERFVEAQDGVFDAALSELSAGRKRSHWMWFVLPQIAGLGHSAMARRYAVADLNEAAAYAAHPVLGPRLRACVQAALAHEGRTAREIFGAPDDLKFRSCLTLFMRAAPDEPLFARALDAFYGGAPDEETLRRL